MTERILVEAGAGCGKTTSIIRKFLDALKAKKEGGRAYLPEHCLLLTFTDAAAREMKARIRKERPDLSLQSGFVGTFHSFCLSLLAGARLVDSQAKILSDEELAVLVKDEFLKTLAVESDLSELLSYLNLKEIMTLVFWGSDESEMRAMAPIQEKWQQFKKSTERSLNSLDLEELSETDWPLQALKLIEGDLSADIKFSQRKVLKDISQKNPELLHRVKQMRALQEKNILTPLLNHFDKEEEIFSFLSRKFREIRGKLSSHLTFTEIEKRCLKGLREGRIKVPPLSLIIVDEFQDTSPEQWEIIERLSGEESEWYLVGDPKQSIYAFRRADIRLYQRLKEKIKVLQLSTNYRSSAPVLAATNRLQQLVFSQKLDPAPQNLAVGGQAESLSQAVALTEFEHWHPEVLLERIRARNEALPHRHHAVLFREWRKLYDFAEYLESKKVPFEIQGSENYLEHYLTHALLEELRRVFEGDATLEPQKAPPHRDALTIFYDFCRYLEPERWPQGAEWASAMERLLLDLSGKDLSNWKKIAGLFLSAKTPTQSILAPVKDQASAFRLTLLTVHGSKGLEFDFVYLPDPRERFSTRNHVEDDEIPFTYKVNAQIRSRSLLRELQKVERDFLYESEQKRLFYVAITRAKLGLDFFLPLESPTARADEAPWWGIWREERGLQRFRWSSVLRQLGPAEILSRKATYKAERHAEEFAFRARERKEKLQREIEGQTRGLTAKIQSAEQSWGDAFHQVLEHWSGLEDELQILLTSLPLAQELVENEKATLRALTQKLRDLPELQLYFGILRGDEPDWRLFREEAFIEQSDAEESFRYADVLMLSANQAIILDWKTSISLALLSREDRQEKIKKQLSLYARALKPKIAHVKAIAIGVSRTEQKVEKILEIDF